jgi:integrase
MRGEWSVWVERSGPNWRCRWKGQYGPGQQVFTYKDDANECAKGKRQDFQRQDAGLPVQARVSGNYSHFKIEYLRWLDSRRSPRTRYLAARALSLFEQHGGPTFPDRQRVRVFGDWLLKRYKPNGVRIVLRHAKAAFRWAMREGMLDADPFAFYEFPAAEKVARVLKPDELKRIFSELRPNILRAVFFVLYTGLRLSEVSWLDWSGISKRGDKWYMTVKKSKTRRAEGEETKTQALHPLAVSVLGAPQKSGSVFGLSKFTISESFREAVQRTGLGRVRLHDLRHTWATYLGQSEKDIRALMQVGGWSTLQAAMIYQHETDERLEITRRFSLPAPWEPLDAPSRPLARKQKKTESQTRK